MEYSKSFLGLPDNRQFRNTGSQISLNNPDRAVQNRTVQPVSYWETGIAH